MTKNKYIRTFNDTEKCIFLNMLTKGYGIDQITEVLTDGNDHNLTERTTRIMNQALRDPELASMGIVRSAAGLRPLRLPPAEELESKIKLNRDTIAVNNAMVESIQAQLNQLIMDNEKLEEEYVTMLKKFK